MSFHFAEDFQEIKCVSLGTLKERAMVWYELRCPPSTNINSRVEATLVTANDLAYKVEWRWRGTIARDETTFDRGWKSFTSVQYTNGKTGRIDVTAEVYDQNGYKLDTRECWFMVLV